MSLHRAVSYVCARVLRIGPSDRNADAIECPCQCVPYEYSEDDVVLLGNVRRHCPALREVLLPNHAWSEFAANKIRNVNVARHDSYLLLAVERGYLDRITSPVHRFLLSDGKVDPRLMPQYKQDLPERWLTDADPKAQHKSFRRYFGKICELLVAEWIDQQRWHVTGLAALAASVDIEAVGPCGSTYEFEVKFIGRETDDFLSDVEALEGGAAGGAISGADAANFLILKVFDAARQLRSASGRTVAVVVIDDLAWYRFQVVLRDGMIEWNAPAFLPASSTWGEFLGQKRQGDPNLLSELAPTIRSLSEVWILRITKDLELTLECKIPLEGGR